MPTTYPRCLGPEAGSCSNRTHSSNELYQEKRTQALNQAFPFYGQSPTGLGKAVRFQAITVFGGFPVPNTMKTIVGIQATKGKMPKDRK